MATIVTRTFDLVTDKGLTLANEEFVRKLAIGNNWSKFRVGLLAAVTPNGTSSIYANFMIGLCTGGTPISATLGAAGQGTTQWIGFTFNSGSGTDKTWTYFDGSGKPYVRTVWPAPVILVNGVSQSLSNFSSTNSCLPLAGTGRRFPFFIEIERGTPNYTLACYTPDVANYAAANIDYTPGHLLSVMEIPSAGGTISLGGYNLAKSSGAVGFNPSLPLNTLSIYWGNSTFPLELYAVACRRIA